MMAMMMAKLFLFATTLSNAPVARDRLSLCVSRSELDRLTLRRPLHHRMLEFDRLTLDLTLHILELVPHLQIPAPEQKVDTRRCSRAWRRESLLWWTRGAAVRTSICSHCCCCCYCICGPTRSPQAASFLFGPRPLPIGICESKDPFRFFSASGPHCRLLSPHLSQVKTTPGQASNPGPKRAC